MNNMFVNNKCDAASRSDAQNARNQTLVEAAEAFVPANKYRDFKKTIKARLYTHAHTHIHTPTPITRTMEKPTNATTTRKKTKGFFDEKIQANEKSNNSHGILGDETKEMTSANTQQHSPVNTISDA